MIDQWIARHKKNNWRHNIAKRWFYLVFSVHVSRVISGQDCNRTYRAQLEAGYKHQWRYFTPVFYPRFLLFFFGMIHVITLSPTMESLISLNVVKEVIKTCIHGHLVVNAVSFLLHNFCNTQCVLVNCDTVCFVDKKVPIPMIICGSLQRFYWRFEVSCSWSIHLSTLYWDFIEICH